MADYKINTKISVLSLQIVSGPIYNFVLQGNARKPGVELKFLSYDFGPCYVMKSPLPITALLEMRNRDNTAMSVESLFEKKPFLDVQLASGQVILPLQIESTKDKRGLIETKEFNVLKVPIVFTPRETIKYD